MTSPKNKKITFCFMAVGVVFILTSVFLVVFNEISSLQNAKKAESTVSELLSLMPNVTDGIVDDRVNKDMPVLEISGNDFAGIIEIPSCNVSLPVGAKWSKWDVLKYPCRYEGSIYENNLIIGGCDSKGQFDFAESISLGDLVCITDVTGIRYSYTVSKIEKLDKASADSFSIFEYDLILFLKNTFGKGYTAVFCRSKNKNK